MDRHCGVDTDAGPLGSQADQDIGSQGGVLKFRKPAGPASRDKGARSETTSMDVRCDRCMGGAGAIAGAGPGGARLGGPRVAPDPALDRPPQRG
jgi:hypothetical protein